MIISGQDIVKKLYFIVGMGVRRRTHRVVYERRIDGTSGPGGTLRAHETNTKKPSGHGFLHSAPIFDRLPFAFDKFRILFLPHGGVRLTAAIAAEYNSK